jgi:hypothetical protein
MSGARYALTVLFAINLFALYFGAMYLAGASLGPVGTGLISDDFTSQAAMAASRTVRKDIEALQEWTADELQAVPLINC